MNGLEKSLVKAIKENQKLDGENIINAYISVKDIGSEDIQRVCEPFLFKLGVSCGEDKNTGEYFYIFTGPLNRYAGLRSTLEKNKDVTFFGLNSIGLAAYLYYTEGADFWCVKRTMTK